MNLFLTAYADMLFRVAKQNIIKFKPRSVTDYTAPHTGSTVSTKYVDYLSAKKPFYLAADDYDQMPEDKIPGVDAAIISWFQMHSPFDDTGSHWDTAEQAEQSLETQFSEILGSPTLRFEDPNNDTAFKWFCTQSVIAHRLEKDPKSDGYRIPLAWMLSYEVRPGVEPVGSDAYFDKDLKPLRIENFRGKTVKPGDPDWEIAKYHFRSASALCATIPDHAIYAHMTTGNALVVATRRSLAADHPLRRLLSPFGIKTVGIDDLAAITLVGEKALVNRLAGFTWEGLKRAYADGQENVTMETVPELLARNGTTGLGAKYPWAEDALETWGAIQKFANSYLALYYDENLNLLTTGKPDAALAVWTADIQSLWPYSPERTRKMNTRASLGETIAIMMWAVTGWHQHIALPTDLARTPQFFAQCIPAGAKTVKEMWPIKEKSVTNMLLVGLTAPNGPALMQDFSQFMLDEPARAAVHAFHGELEGVSGAIRARNAKRDFPLKTFDPYSLQISIST